MVSHPEIAALAVPWAAGASLSWRPRSPPGKRRVGTPRPIFLVVKTENRQTSFLASVPCLMPTWGWWRESGCAGGCPASEWFAAEVSERGIVGSGTVELDAGHARADSVAAAQKSSVADAAVFRPLHNGPLTDLMSHYFGTPFMLLWVGLDRKGGHLASPGMLEGRNGPSRNTAPHEPEVAFLRVSSASPSPPRPGPGASRSEECNSIKPSFTPKPGEAVSSLRRPRCPRLRMLLLVRRQEIQSGT
jgi:hypothetical protein